VRHGVDLGDAAGGKRRSCGSRQIVELPAVDTAGAEGLGDGEGTVEEMKLGGDELDINEARRQRPQGERRLERGDPSSRHED
jgi:hypothetical protein